MASTMAQIHGGFKPISQTQTPSRKVFFGQGLNNTITFLNPKATFAKLSKNRKPLTVFAEKVVGIDLGTTNSAVGAMEGGKPVIVTNVEGQRTTPSDVAYTKNGDRLVGQIAKRQAVVNPENTFFSGKRFIGRKMSEVNAESKQVSYNVVRDENGNVKLDCPAIGKQFAAEEISAQVLRKLVVKSLTGKEPNVTVNPDEVVALGAAVQPSLPQNNVVEDDDLDEDAFEALFRQLEEDLKNDDPSALDGDEEISEEDLALLERELEEALGDEALQHAFSSSVDESETETGKEGTDNDDEEDYDDEEEEDKQVVLKNWQIRRLAYALKNGRRKTSIKNLAAETCLDRAFVLELLRDPPPKLLLMSASLPDIPAPILEPKAKHVEDVPSVNAIESEEIDSKKPDSKVKVPVHAMQSSWSAQKRIKKVQLDTLERVYGRTKRPTNAMISNIVHVTNLPRKRVVKWFEDKRTEDEVPDRRVPYQRSTPETVSTS